MFPWSFQAVNPGFLPMDTKAYVKVEPGVSWTLNVVLGQGHDTPMGIGMRDFSWTFSLEDTLLKL